MTWIGDRKLVQWPWCYIGNAGGDAVGGGNGGESARLNCLSSFLSDEFGGSIF